VVLPLSIPSPSDAWQVFNLGQWFRDIGWKSFGLNIDLRASTACIVIGLVLAIIVTSTRLTRRKAEPGIIVDIAIWAIPLGIIGGRIGHVLSHPDFYFGAGKDPLVALYFWQGGTSLFGALLGGVIGVAIGCRFSGLRVTSVLDAAVPGLFLGIAATRLGDWFEREYFGTPTSAPWGLQIPTADADFPLGLPASTVFQPVFLYEIILCLVGIGVVLSAAQRFELQWGRVFALALIWYGLGRSWFESLRIDPSLHFGGIRTNVWLAWVVAIIGIIVFVAQKSRHTGQEPSVYRQGRGWSPAAAVDSDDTYPEVDEGNEAVVAATSPVRVKATRSVTSGAGTK
jgi:prolipoprotein diacylglyceryl transferase